jgi:hypothetical protein
MSMCWCWNSWYRWWRLHGYKFLCDWDNNWKKREVNTTFLKLLFRMHPGWYTSYHVHQFSFLSGASCPWATVVHGFKVSVRCLKKRLKKHEDVGSCVRLGIQVMAGKAGGRKLVSPVDMNMYGRCWKLFLELSSIFYRFCAYYCWPTSSSTELLLTC